MDKQELINGYFEGSLSQNQLEEVDYLLSTDVEFASELEFEKELKIALKKEERQNIKSQFSELSKEHAKPKPKVIKLRPWLAAASIALCIGLGTYFLFFYSSNINTAELYAANFMPYDNVVQPIERSNQLENLKTQAFTAYENEEYQKALQLFKELNTKQNDNYIDFYSAMVYMQLDKQKLAVSLLKNYIEKQGELKDRATWYLALAYLKLGKLENCKSELEKLIAWNTFKTNSAKELLSKLN